MEVVVVKVRPFNGDRKMHVLRFLFSSECFSISLVKSKLRDLFPYGFYKPIIERYVIDYAFEPENESFLALCNHEYLSQYLTGTIKK